jgi:hypothetical protein
LCKTADMLVRLIRAALLALVSIALSVAPSFAQQPRRVVAVGDLHGDYAAWLDIARDAGLIDPTGRWTAGSTTLVQLGDVTDRGPDSLKIIRSLQQLEKQAPRSGGKVIVVLGNHEAMNLLGDYRYTTAGEYAAFVDSQSAALRNRVYENDHIRLEALYRGQNPTITAAQARDTWMADHPLGWVEHRIAWKPTGELGRWASRNPAVAKVGDTLFVHGGLSSEYSKLTLEEINRRVRDAMTSIDDSPKSILDDPLGPLWYRGLAGPDPEADAERGPAAGPRPTIDQELTTVLTAYGAKRIIIAHTPNLGGIVIASGGRLVRIDTGISRFYGGPMTWLEIVGDRLIPHTVRRSGQ